jgi:hypothetical protein
MLNNIGSTGLFVFSVLFLLSFGACEETPCDDVSCSGHGTCHWTAEETPYCNCDAGYIQSVYDSTKCFRTSGGGTNNCKPVIYLYPTSESLISVRFREPENLSLTYTYPIYPDEGWIVFARNDGTLQDPLTGKMYYSLYWEGEIDEPEVPYTGAIVSRDDIVPFLEEQLSTLGLNWREANEFIIYWLPILGEYPYSFIHFLTSTYSEAVPLEIDPRPDAIIRFSMRYSGLDTLPNVLPIPQDFSAPKRDGFVFVEWGGAKLSGFSTSGGM